MNEKLSLKTKLGYGIGAAGDTLPYNLFTTYFLFFLTDVAGVTPAAAGIVSSISIAWNAVTYPVVGYLSDKSPNPKGRRNPWMFNSLWPLAIFVFLLFLPVQMNPVLKAGYYLLFAMAMWTAFTSYNVPWSALGAELTQDYDERNTLRLMVSFLSVPFTLMTSSGPVFITDRLGKIGISSQVSWAVIGALGGAVILSFGLISWNSVRKKEKRQVQADRKEKSAGFLRNFGELLKIRAYRIIVIVMALYNVGFTFFFNLNVYVMKYCAEMTDLQQATYWSVYSLVSFASLFLIMQVANRMGKNMCLILFGGAFCVVEIVFFTMGISSFPQMMVYGILSTIATSSYYSIIYSFIYDCSEIDEYIYGKRREASLISCAQFVLKIGVAVSNAVTGILLAAYGYTGSGTESAETAHGLLVIQNLIPAAIVLAALLLFFAYPVNKKRYNALLEALNARKQGRECSTEEFEKLIR